MVVDNLFGIVVKCFLIMMIVFGVVSRLFIVLVVRLFSVVGLLLGMVLISWFDILCRLLVVKGVIVYIGMWCL